MGKVACQTIRIGRGVCGTAAQGDGKTVLVHDVDAFPGHIACDGDSKSEIVVPIRAGGKVCFSFIFCFFASLTFLDLLGRHGGWLPCPSAFQAPIVSSLPFFRLTYKRSLTKQVVGVIDIDCTELNGFDEHDQTGLEAIADLLGKSCDW